MFVWVLLLRMVVRGVDCNPACNGKPHHHTSMSAVLVAILFAYQRPELTLLPSDYGTSTKEKEWIAPSFLYLRDFHLIPYPTSQAPVADVPSLPRSFAASVAGPCALYIYASEANVLYSFSQSLRKAHRR